MKRRDSRLPSLFAGFSESERTALLARAATREFATHDLLFRQGDPARSLFMIRTGRVALTYTSVKGRHIVLRLLGPEDAFGLASLVRDYDDISSAIAAVPTTVYLWDAMALRGGALYHRILENAFRMTLQYLTEYGERHVGLLTQTAEQRLARTLTHLAETSGRVLPTGVEVEMSNDDLAALSDVGMFTASRQLKQWERDGHLIKRRQRVLIRDPKALLPR